jgi:ATP-dependent RNA helicase RhlE
MGRQTIWGGAGKAPSREVMAAAAKAARREMMERIRENKAAEGTKKDRPDSGRRAQPQQARQSQPPKPRHANGGGQPQQPRRGRDDRVERVERFEGDDDRMPSHIDPLKTNLPTRRDMTGVKRVSGNGQPDPTRTSIDSMGATGKGNRNRNRGNGGGFAQRPAGRFGTR